MVVGGGGGGLKSFSCHTQLWSWVKVELGLWQNLVTNIGYRLCEKVNVFGSQLLFTNVLTIFLINQRLLTTKLCQQLILSTNFYYQLNLLTPIFQYLWKIFNFAVCFSLQLEKLHGKRKDVIFIFSFSYVYWIIFLGWEVQFEKSSFY